MTRLCKVEVTLPRVRGGRRRAGGVNEQTGIRSIRRLAAGCDAICARHI